MNFAYIRRTRRTVYEAPVLPIRYVTNRFEDVVWINGREAQVCCKHQIYH